MFSLRITVKGRNQPSLPSAITKAIFTLGKLIEKMPAMATRTVLAMATLGDATQIEMILLVLCHPS
jgi:hypothetical protein